MSWLSGPNLLTDPLHTPVGAGNATGPWESITTPGVIYAVTYQFETLNTAIWKATTRDGTDFTIVWTGTSRQYIPNRTWFGNDFIVVTGKVNSTGEWWVIVYDTVNNTVAEIDTALNGSAVGGAWGMRFSNGDIGLFYCGSGFAPSVLKFKRWAGAAWSGVTNLTASTLNSLDFLDNIGDDAYLIYRYNVPASVRFISFSGGVASAESVIYTGSPSIELRQPSLVIFNNQIYVQLGSIGVYRSDSLTPTSWTQTLATPTNGSISLSVYNSTLYAIWNVQVVVGDVVNQDQMYVQKYLGSDTWTAAILGVDFLVNPPPIAPLTGPNNSHYHSSNILSDGTVGTHADFYTASSLCSTTYTHYQVTFPSLTPDPAHIQYRTISTPIILTGPPTGNIADFILKGINIYGVRMYPERPNNLQRF